MLFGLKDYLYGAALLILVAGFGWYTVHERDLGKARELAILQESSQKLQAAADAHVAALVAQHDHEVASLKGTYENQRIIDSAQRISDAQRLHNYDAYRSAGTPVPGASGGPGNPPVSAGSSSADVVRFERLEQVALGLAAAGRAVSASLTECEVERDSLVTH